MTGTRWAGFTLLEVMLALFLMGIGVLAVAPMFVYAVRSNGSSSDLNQVGAVAMERMELLRARPYTELKAGGSLTSNATVDGEPYFDVSDPDVIVRWQIASVASPTGARSIVLRAAATRAAPGRQKQVTLFSMRGL